MTAPRAEFDRDQFDEAYPAGIERTWWQIARCKVIERAFARHVQRGLRVMEIGCGTGIVTACLRRQGWDVTGVDLGQPQDGLQEPEHLLLGTDAFDLPQPVRDGVDVLALFDVVEHLPDAPAFLTRSLERFPRAQTVVVTVPARQELWTSFDDHFGHFRRYDRKMLRAELARSGLHADHASYFFHALYPAIAVNNLLHGRRRSIRFTAPAPGAASFAHAILGSLFASEHWLLPGSVRGSSIIAVARRA